MLFALATLATAVVGDQPFLTVSSDGSSLEFRGSPVFLSGANQPWINYGADFGNNQTQGAQCNLYEYVNNVSAAGGNSMRFWLFVEGQSIPAFDGSGNVVATDGAGSLIREMRSYLQYAASKNVLVTLCLWNGALMRQQSVKDLFTDMVKLQSFFDNALTPMVRALSNESALAAYEVMNEPEGSVAIASNASDPCFDTQTVLGGSGAGWAGSKIPMYNLQRFVAKHAAAIRAADPKALVTVGSWSQYASTDATVDPQRKFFNYWKDECLVKANGGDTNSKLDFYQIHTYPNNGNFDPSSPMSVNTDALKLSKPVVIGEFAAKNAKSQSVEELYQHAVSSGYAGAWDWSLIGGDKQDGYTDAIAGMNAVKDDKRIAIDIPGEAPSVKCDCSDVPPDSQYTCAQQASWGKCGFSWMKGYCCKSCFGCKGCS